MALQLQLKTYVACCTHGDRFVPARTSASGMRYDFESPRFIYIPDAMSLLKKMKVLNGAATFLRYSISKQILPLCHGQ